MSPTYTLHCSKRTSSTPEMCRRRQEALTPKLDGWRHKPGSRFRERRKDPGLLRRDDEGIPEYARHYGGSTIPICSINKTLQARNDTSESQAWSFATSNDLKTQASTGKCDMWGGSTISTEHPKVYGPVARAGCSKFGNAKGSTQ